MASGADFFASEERKADEPREILVWSCNWLAVAVFEACQLTLVAGMGVYYQGISALEAKAACDLLQVRRSDQPDVLLDVQFMGRTVSDALNERAKKD